MLGTPEICPAWGSHMPAAPWYVSACRVQERRCAGDTVRAAAHQLVAPTSWQLHAPTMWKKAGSFQHTCVSQVMLPQLTGYVMVNNLRVRCDEAEVELIVQQPLRLQQWRVARDMHT